MGGVVTQPRTPVAASQRDREAFPGRDGRGCSDPFAVCQFVGTWSGVTG